MNTTLVQRAAEPRAAWALEQAGLPPLLARLYAARGVSVDEVEDGLDKLLPPDSLLHARQAGEALADALASGARVCIAADYDSDGATACAVALRGLSLLGFARSHLAYVVPDRFVHGYGLSPGLVDLSLKAFGPDGPKPDWLVTVDNGIASVEGVAHANALGLRVLVTDHHLPGEQMPAAAVIVNPNQAGCRFASKHLAGVGVMFYVLLATRQVLRERGHFAAAGQPRLDGLLDLVALGTVADVVRLDANNRRLVAQGLKRIRAGRMNPGVSALFRVAGRDPMRATAEDFGFALAPRLNAAGRLADMRAGIECLCTDDAERAQVLALALDQMNRERRQIEASMREQAFALVRQRLTLPQGLATGDGVRTPAPLAAITVFDPDFHEGVVGIIASRLKEVWHRPALVLARGQDGLLKGSGRSIAGFHLRDALDWVDKRHPGLLLRFGGHAMAAGCTLAEDRLPELAEALAEVAAQWIAPDALARRRWVDGPLQGDDLSLEVARLLGGQVWGAGFEAPVFCNRAALVSQRVVGERHLALKLRLEGETQPRDAIWFQRESPAPAQGWLAYQLSVDEFRGEERLRLQVLEFLESAPLKA
jgi:single-stranded-DNA-specific exonuclease